MNAGRTRILPGVDFQTLRRRGYPRSWPAQYIRESVPLQLWPTEVLEGSGIALSIRIIEAVFDLSLDSSTDKLVLLALAKFASDQGDCWPSVATLVRVTELSERTVHNAIARLKQSGHIEVIHMPRQSNVFVIHNPAPPAPRGAARAPVGVQHVHPESSSESSKNLRREKPLETVAERRQSREAMHRVIHRIGRR